MFGTVGPRQRDRGRDGPGTGDSAPRDPTRESRGSTGPGGVKGRNPGAVRDRSEESNGLPPLREETQRQGERRKSEPKVAS